MSFALFILVNLVLFVRPAEVVPALIGLPIYNVLINACLVSALFPVIEQLSGRNIKRQPITICVLGLLASVILSHLMNGDSWSAREKGTEFLKIVQYYFLLVAIVNSPKRLQQFLFWLVGFTVVLSGLAVLQYHGYIDIPALEAMERIETDDDGEQYIIYQLCSTGIYNDPNDLCLILVVGIMISLHRLSDRSGGLLRVAWVGPIVLFLYSIILTASRGGFLAMITGLLTLFVSRFGWRKSIPIALVAVPAIFLLSGGRQTKISAGEDTAQERMKLWSEGLSMVNRSPKWAATGIGAGNYAEEMNQVAHNSYVHAFVELGFFGGVFFLGAFYLSCRALRSVGKRPPDEVEPAMRDLRPFLMALIAGYAAGMFSLSRCYIVPTYMVLGLVAVYLRVGVYSPGDESPPFDLMLWRRLAVVGVGFLVFIQIFIRVNVQWGG